MLHSLRNYEYSTKPVLLVRYPEKYRPLALGHSRTQRSMIQAERDDIPRICLLIWNELENAGTPRTLYRAEYVLALDIGFMHTNDTSCVYGIRVHGNDETSEYSPKVLEYLKNTVGKV